MVIAQGTVPQLRDNAASQIGPFLSEKTEITAAAAHASRRHCVESGVIRLSTGAIHTVKPMEIAYSERAS